MGDILKLNGNAYEFPKDGAGASVLEDLEEEINLLFEIPDRPRSLPLGKHARAIRVLTHRILAQQYPELRPEDVSVNLPGLIRLIPMLLRALGFEAKEGVPVGEGSGPAASISASSSAP